MTFRVLVPQTIAAEGLTELRKAGLEVVESRGTDLKSLQASIRDCDAVLVRTAQMSADLLESAPDLQVISRHGAGVDNIDLQYCRERGIRVTHAPEANTTAVAEHTIMMLLAVAKNLVACDTEARRGNFEARHSHYGIELAGKTLGVVGLGRIGRSVAARAASGLEMRTIGFDPYAAKGLVGDVVTQVSLETLLAESDVVSVHVPLVSTTRGLIDAKIFDQMKPGSHFINCSRGGVVDERALEAALRSGRLRGAAIDVLESEPVLAGNPLAKLPNVILTPHMAAHTPESMVRMAQHAAQGIISIAEGQEPKWAVV